MRKKWMPQKIGTWPNFYWWEIDELIPFFVGLVIAIMGGSTWWIVGGVVASWIYRRYKRSTVHLVWRDFFVAYGIFDLFGYPKGTERTFAE